jgi:hypothetical protein
MRHILFVFVLFWSAVSSAAEALKTPNISANALFLYRNSNFHQQDVNLTTPDQERNGFNIQETELRFEADVDPVTRLNLVLSVRPEYSGDGTKVEEKWIIEPEEAFVESIALDAVTLKGGKLKAAMGKHNLLHTHAFPFVGAPLASAALLGDEGLVDTGISAELLLPSPWFSELSLQFLRGEGENTQFSSPSPSDGVGLVHWKNLFDLSGDLTMEAGVSYAQGENSTAGQTRLSGADLTFKWRPAEGGRSKSFAWTTEYLARTQTQPAVDDEQAQGIASWVQYQFARQWAALYRHDTLTMKGSFDPLAFANDSQERESVAVVYLPSEFSSFKLEFNQRHGPANANGETVERSVFLQGNFTIGAHPAHAY